MCRTDDHEPLPGLLTWAEHRVIQRRATDAPRQRPPGRRDEH